MLSLKKVSMLLDDLDKKILELDEKLKEFEQKTDSKFVVVEQSISSILGE